MSCCTVICSAGRTLTIGEAAFLSAGSVLTNDVPSLTLCAGPRVRAVATVTVPYTLEANHRDFVRGLRPLRVSNKGKEETGEVS